MLVCTYCRTPFNGNSLYCCRSCELLSAWIHKGLSPLKAQNDGSDSHIKWKKYDVPALENTFNISTSTNYKKFRFYIEGLQCASCVHLLEDFPQFYSGIRYAQVNYSERTMIIECNIKASLADIIHAISKLGYNPIPLNEPEQHLTALKNENRNFLKRIGVAGAIAGNLMLFSIPIYAGLMGQLGHIFIGLSLVLFLPLLFYCATPFYKKAFSGVLSRQANVDMMIVIALWGGFLLSCYNLLKGIENVYFDSTASFIFLILLTRYLLRSYHDRIPAQNIFNDLFLHEVYKVKLRNGSFLNLNFEQLEPNQEVVLKKHQILPCDAYLKSDQSFFDLSFLTGEVVPEVRHSGDVILAGSQVTEDDVVVMIKAPARESDLAKNLNPINLLDNQDKNKIKTITDKAAHTLTLYVFGIAALFFVVTYPILGAEAFKRCLALIIIACPCAIAFGTPLAHSLGLRKASKTGFFIKSSQVFEKLSQIKKVIFDKTGTLTSSQLVLINSFPKALSYFDKSMILGLEKNSFHPVAVSLRKSWGFVETLKLDHVVEKIGYGVETWYQGSFYQLTKATKLTSEANSSDQNQVLQIDYLVNGQHQGYLYFQEQVRAESSYVVEKLQGQNLDVMMLTGDQRLRAIEVARQVGIRPVHVFSEQTAQSKKDFINQQNPCLYIGDGLNDLPALHTAYVSFAVRGVFESTFKVSDIYAPKKRLDAILEIIGLSSQVQSVLKVNLLFALFYNTVGGILALLGLVNPLMAAILMPLSSLVILTHTYQRLR